MMGVMIMKWFLLFMMLTFSVCANDLNTAQLGNMVGQMDIKKSDIEQSLGQLKAQGMISEEDYQKALASLKGVKDEDIKALQQKAAEEMKNNPKLKQDVQKILDKQNTGK